MKKPMIGFACLNIKLRRLIGVPLGRLVRVAVNSTLRNGEGNAISCEAELETTFLLLSSVR